MSSLTEFLEARINEDETTVQRPWTGGAIWGEMGVLGAERVVGAAEQADVDRIAKAFADRVLAECAAKRAILGIHSATRAGDCANCSHKPTEAWVPHPCPTVRALAAVYASHPDFDPSWAGGTQP